MYIDVELAREYAVKYASQLNKRREPEGDTLLTAMENLDPENAVTTGTFTKMYNKINNKGTQSIFQTVHDNINLPFVSKNFDCKPCSTFCISVVKHSNESTINNDNNE